MPRSARIDFDGIVAAAIVVGDREGLAGLTMRRVGIELGVEAMALYRYVPGKDALLAAMAEQLLAEITPAGPGDDWETATRRSLMSVRDVARRHPELFAMALDRAPHTLAEAHLIEGFLSLMAGQGMDGPTALSVFRVLSDYAIGFALSDRHGLTLDPARSTLGADRLPATEFPQITRLRPHLPTLDADATFTFGLDLLLGAVRRLLPPKP